LIVVAPESPGWLALALEREGLERSSTRVVATGALLRRASTVWARGRAHRRIAARFAIRRLADRLASHRLAGETEVVYAPSLAARRTFAVAHRGERHVRCILVEDLPDLGRLHDDLDRAALAHPEARFLRRYRADRSQIVRQAAERVLADRVLVRSEFSRDALVSSGVDPARIELISEPVPVGARRPIDRSRPTVLLAGLATARAGLFEALALLEWLPEATLVVRAGEGLEPVDALDRAEVRQGTAAELDRLEGIDLVLAPSWCEVDLPQVALAARMGIAVVATDRAAGRVDLTIAGASVTPGDLDGLKGAVTSLLRG
jgi:hypothetical protein